jgi:hypothetical protein
VTTPILPGQRHRSVLTSGPSASQHRSLPQNDCGMQLPVCAAAVYLRTRRAGTLQVDPNTLNVGFRIAVLNESGEVPALVNLFDRALVRGRRHAAALVGYGLGNDLKAIASLTDRRLPGVVGVSLAWADRASKRRGMARMVDTRHDIAPAVAERVDVSLEADAAAMVSTSTRCAEASLIRCLAIALTAAWHVDTYRWDGIFSVRTAAAASAWDCFTSA